MPSQLIPHLISRGIYTGAGGFNNRAAGLEFMVMPRAAHIERSQSSSSTHDRGIYHDKDEPLGRGYQRLHLLTGETLCSETSLWLTQATTVLVVALIEAGARPGDAIPIADPVKALRKFAVDYNCRCSVPAHDGRRWSAIEIQEHYLKFVENYIDHDAMPGWAEEGCKKWRDILDLLKQGPAAVATILDWAIKLPQYQRFAQKRGVPWESLPHWNHVVERLRVGFIELGLDVPRHRLAAEALKSERPLAHVEKQLTPHFRQHGLEWDQLETFLNVQQQLFELDNRFGELGDGGIFNALDAAGVLQHHIDGVDRIDQAMTDAPLVGRARIRGAGIKRLHREKHRYSCNWYGIYDLEKGRQLDLSDPFEQHEKWTKSRHEVPLRSSHLRLRDPMREVERAYDRGDYERVVGILRDAGAALPGAGRSETDRMLAWAQARRGFLDAPDILRRLLPAAADAPPLWLITDFVCAYRFGGGFHPDQQIAEWIRLGHEVVNDQFQGDSGQDLALFEHEGYYLLCRNELSAAEEKLNAICQQGVTGRRYAARAAASLSEVYRRQGRLTESLRMQKQAAREMALRHRDGDLADFALPQLAKLQDNAVQAVTILDQALGVQRGLGSLVGEARTLALRARLHEGRLDTDEIKQRLEQVKTQRPALEQCAVLARLLSDWDRWIGPLKPDENDDIYWGV